MTEDMAETERSLIGNTLFLCGTLGSVMTGERCA